MIRAAPDRYLTMLIAASELEIRLLNTFTIYATHGCALQGKLYFLKKGNLYQKACAFPNVGRYRLLFKRFIHRGGGPTVSAERKV